MARPLVIALVGLPGAGKSTLAAALCRGCGLCEVNRDEIRAAMFPSCSYSDEEKAAACAAMLAAVETNCRLGRGSVVDGATFARRAEREVLRTRVGASGGELLLLWLDCAPALAAQRVARDRAAAHLAQDRDTALVESVARRFEPPSGEAIRIDAGQPAAEVCAQALCAVRARARGGGPDDDAALTPDHGAIP